MVLLQELTTSKEKVLSFFGSFFIGWEMISSNSKHFLGGLLLFRDPNCLGASPYLTEVVFFL